MIKGLLAVFTAFYVIEYCEDHVTDGVMYLMHCPPGDYDCNTVYHKSCGHLTKRKDLKEALEFINKPEKDCVKETVWSDMGPAVVNKCKPIRGFRFQGLYTVSNVSLHLEPRKKKRTVTVQKEEEYEVNEWVY